MTQYIDKDALVGMIKHHIKEESHSYFCKCLISEIDTLEVKEVDVDLEKELDEYFDTHDYEFVFDDYLELAKHFFELGIKAAQKGE